MSLFDLFADFVRYLHSEAFRHMARHPEHPNAFTRQRKLPLPSLIVVMLTGLSESLQAKLDQLFGQLQQQAQLVHAVSEQAFAQARAKQALARRTAIAQRLPDQQAEQAGWMSCWQGLRLVSADASFVLFSLRASHVRRAADRDQIVFGLYLPYAGRLMATGGDGPDCPADLPT